MRCPSSSPLTAAARPGRSSFAAGCTTAARVAATLATLVGLVTGTAASDWPQFGHDAQRTNATAEEVAPPYCYAWKWYGVPIASRAQPIVSGGRLLVGSMDGVLYARAAATGAPIWEFATDGPIRHSPALVGDLVITGSHDGVTYALAAADGRLAWKASTGPSQTAPLVDEPRGRIFVASTTGVLTALAASTGRVLWQRNLGAPILATPSLSVDATSVLTGTEAVEAVSVDAATGSIHWRAPLQGQSLADRAPVVVGNVVLYRTQPVDFFHDLLHEGDDVMEEAGPAHADWGRDWAAVKPRILSYLQAQPSKRTLFVLDVATGAERGLPPVLYTYGNQDVPAMPAVASETEVLLPYRARHGIQTDAGSIHVTSRYDAEIGRMDTTTLDITGLRQRDYPAYATEFRLTSDEPGQLTLAGQWLLVDNWERLGSVSLRTGELAHIGAVSNDWPECFVQCGPGTVRPFFPLQGEGPAYPFPSPRVTEGRQRPGAVVADGLVIWRVIEGGLAAFAHRSGNTCPAPLVHPTAAGPRAPRDLHVVTGQPRSQMTPREVVWWRAPALRVAPDDPLVARLRDEVRDLVALGAHPLPFFVQRGFSSPLMWPKDSANPPGPPAVSLAGHGSVYWHDPAELLYSLAAAYPYLDAALQASTKAFVAREMAAYPPLQNLPWSGLDWLKQGAARERYGVPFRGRLDSWPPPAPPLAAIYAVWRWVDATADRSFAESQWAAARSLFAARRADVDCYADIAGAIGYARLGTLLGDSAAAADGETVAVAAMNRMTDLDSFARRAERTYPDPRDQFTGWSLPVFFGLTPEVGLYLRGQVGARATSLLRSKEEGDGVRWWYLTRAGVQAERGETSYLAPRLAWSHFLAHAYLRGASRADLTRWLDRPWGRGDVYSIQKVVAALEAP